MRLQAQTFFRMSRLAPLVGPLVTRGGGCDPRRLSLHYIASSGADHGFHGPTGWGCKLPGEEQTRFSHHPGRTTGGSTRYPWARIWLSWPLPAYGFHWPTGSAPTRRTKRFSHGTACTTGRSTGYPWTRKWPSSPLAALYCEFGLRPRVPWVHRFGLFRSQTQNQTLFRIARLAPLVGPLVTRGQGYGSHGLSLRYIVNLGSDHGFHWSTGWGCKRLGEIQKRFSHDQGRTTAGEPPAPHGCFDVVLSHLSALRGGCFTPQSGFFYICLKIIYFKKIRL